LSESFSAYKKTPEMVDSGLTLVFKKNTSPVHTPRHKQLQFRPLRKMNQQKVSHLPKFSNLENIRTCTLSLSVHHSNDVIDGSILIHSESGWMMDE